MFLALCGASMQYDFIVYQQHSYDVDNIFKRLPDSQRSWVICPNTTVHEVLEHGFESSLDSKIFGLLL